MAYTITKEKNLYNFTMEGKTKPYVLDINTGILYGLSGKAIKNYPPHFKDALSDNQYTDGIIGFLAYETNWWCNLPLAELPTRVNKLKTIDRLNSIGYYNIHTISRHDYDDDTLNCIDKHFKKFVKARKENPNLTIGEFAEVYAETMWREKHHLTPDTHLTENILHNLYRNKNEYPSKYTSYVVHYIRHGLTDYYYTIDNEIDMYTMYRKLRSYFHMCDELGIEPTKDDFYRSYINISRFYRVEKLRINNDKIVKHYANRPQLNFENDEYIVVIPQTTNDFRNEADYQHNCVFSMYLPRVLEGTTNVVFIRRKDDINTPFITCEVDDSGRIIQYLTRYNSSNVGETAKRFRVEYANHLASNWK